MRLAALRLVAGHPGRRLGLGALTRASPLAAPARHFGSDGRRLFSGSVPPEKSDDVDSTATADGIEASSSSAVEAFQADSGDASEGTEASRLEAMWRLGSRGGGAASSSDEWVPRLSLECAALADSCRPSEDRLLERDTLVKCLKRAANRAVDGCSVLLFGSASSGLWSADSDLDICLLVPGIDHRQAQVKTLKKVALELRRLGADRRIRPRLGAQMPILRWESRRAGGLACDVSVNNGLAVANSQLLARYMEVDDRLRVLGLCVKAWAKDRGINDRSRGTLSSFSLVLMLVHFLQRRDPPVLPSLQDLAVARGQAPIYLNGADCRYCDDPVEIARELKRLRGASEPNDESVGLLLHEFFRHFGYTYARGTIAVRSRSKFADRADEDQCYLVVDNPFEPGRDVANVEVCHYTRLREEFRRAHAMLHEGRNLKEVCEAPEMPGFSPLSEAIRPGFNVPIRSPTAA